MIKRIIFFSVLCFFFIFSSRAQEPTVKGRILSNVYALPEAGTWFYFIDGAYGISKYFDLGTNFGTSFFPKNVQNYLINIDARYYFTNWVFKKPSKIELYLKASVGYHWTQSESNSNEGSMYAGYLGIRFFPLKRVGIMAEAGMNSFGVSFRTNFGLSFLLKK